MWREQALIFEAKAAEQKKEDKEDADADTS
jgi:hypothetical protein